MQIWRLLFFILLLILGNNVLLFGQEDVKIKKSEFKLNKKGKRKAWKNIRYGDYFYEQHTQGSYNKALKYYLKAYDYNDKNAELNYKIGVCYIESVAGFKALFYLKSSIELKKSVAEDIDYHLARAYHLNYKFDKAIKYYENYIKKIIDNPAKTEYVDKKIEECKYGKKFMEDSISVKISNLSLINTKYKDYGSLISADGSKMFFSSRRPNKTGDIDPDDDQYYEDIYFSKKDSTDWSIPESVKSLNSPGHDDVVGLSHDGNTLILYNNGDLYYSVLEGNEWTKPKSFPKQINSKEIESSACFSLDGNTLFFVRGKTRDPLTSNGDIYYSRKNLQGKWTEAKVLSSKVNSAYDEDGLFMFADGKTLYFSSKGHNSMGGYDVFKTIIDEEGDFSEPENLGYPINTPNNDIYFVMEPNNYIGYYTTVKNDTEGYTDIYQIRYTGNMFLDSEDNLLAGIAEPISEVNLSKKVLVVINGVIKDKKNNTPVDAEILIIDNNTDEVVYRTKANSENGEYSVTVPAGKNYGMVIRKDGYMFQSENFDLVSSSNYQEINQDFKIERIELNISSTLNNIFFDFGSSSLKESSKPELKRVVKFMNSNPKMKIEISGHTDNIGSYEENINLSKERANAVASFLLDAGIDKNRIVTKGFGYNKPIASNETAEGRQKNRRVEFKIIEI